MRNFLFKSWIKIAVLLLLTVSAVELWFGIDAISILHLIPPMLFSFIDTMGIPQDALMRQCNLTSWCNTIIAGYMIIFVLINILLVVLRGLFGSVRQRYMQM